MAGWDDTFIPTNYVAAMEDGFFTTFDIDAGPALSQTSPFVYTVPVSGVGPFSFATGAAVEQDGSGAAYITFAVPGNPRGPNGIFVSKVLADQSVAWTANISTAPVDAVTAVALSPSGELFVTGGTFLKLGREAFGQEDAFLMKIDKRTGSPIWTTQAGGANSDYPTALAFDAAGHVYISGITVANQDEADLFAMKFAGSGELLGELGGGHDRGRSGDRAGRHPVRRGADRRLHAGGRCRAAERGGEDMFIVLAVLGDVTPSAGTGPEPPSCSGQPAICGANGNADCCTSPLVPSGSYHRGYDLAGDGDSGDTNSPATISGFRLDAYEVTVARFRAFVNAGMGRNSRHLRPAPGRTRGSPAAVGTRAGTRAWRRTRRLRAALACDPMFGSGQCAAATAAAHQLRHLVRASPAARGRQLPARRGGVHYAAAGGDQRRAFPWSVPPAPLLVDPGGRELLRRTDCVSDGMPDCAVTNLVAVGTRPAGDGRWGQSVLGRATCRVGARLFRRLPVAV